MGKIFGNLSLIFGLISLAPSSFSYFAIPVPVFRILLVLTSLIFIGVGILCGGIGIVKDDIKGLAKTGLVFSSIALINFIAATLVSSLVYT